MLNSEVKNLSGAKWADAGKRLRELRENYVDDRGRKLSLFKVAKQLHISGNYLSELERGVKCPSDVVLHSIAEFYSIDKGELFALYEKIVPEQKEYLLANPPLRKTLTSLSIDENLTDEEKEYLSGELYKLYEQLTEKKKGTERKRGK